MKIMPKIIVWMLSLIAVFIVANLVIWCFQYKWINNYIQILENKNWSSTIEQININDPISIFSMFYEEGYINISDTTDLTQTWNILSEDDIVDIQNTTWDIVEENTIDPYDPEFEDDFNSFFDGESSGIDQETGITIEDDIILEEIDTGVEHNSVAEELIKKFNE